MLFACHLDQEGKLKHACIAAAVLAVAIALGARTAAAEDYVIGPDDQLMIHVADHPELSTDRAVVSRSGTITHPVWGEVRVQNLNASQVEAAVRQLLSADYLEDPRVAVTVVQANQLLVWLLTPSGGTSPYRLGVNGKLSELLILSGASTQTCKRMMILVMRKETRQVTQDKPTAEDKPTADDKPAAEGQPAEQPTVKAVDITARTTVDLYDLMIRGRKELDLPLKRDDWLQLVWRDPRKRQSYIFAVDPIHALPGAYEHAAGELTAPLLRKACDRWSPGEQTEATKIALDSDDLGIVGRWPAGDNQAAIFGDVLRPGVMDLTPDLTVGRMLAKAGLSPRAGSLSKVIKLSRGGADAETFYLMSDSADAGYGITNAPGPGDVVFVIGDWRE